MRVSVHFVAIIVDSGRTTFTGHSFLVDGKPRRGLTAIVERAVPACYHAAGTLARECDGCRRHVAVRFAATGSHGRVSRRRQRNGEQVLSAPPVRRRCLGGADAREHGSAVDRLVSAAHRRPALLLAGDMDPCVVTLLTYIACVLKLRIVGTQVPMTSDRLVFATAIDVLAVDADDGLQVLEIKASRTAVAASADGCYRHGGDEHSRYARHQMQLWAMTTTLREELGVAVAGAAVVCTTPGSYIGHYPLDTALVRRRAAVWRQAFFDYKHSPAS